MKLFKSKLEIPGAPLMSENPLPLFRAKEHDQHFTSNGTLSEAELANFGRHTGFRLLPYGMQDRYTMERTLRQYETIVLENDKLRAEFLPQYGGRLYSLYNKELGQELLFKNPVFQPANLAIRNAWFSGGIEWNVGQLGHAFHTCDDVYFARCQADGEEFLRMYDYVRTTGLFWQIDFHLPEHSSFLYAHVRIINDGAQSQPLYWWTNTAVPERGARIFSGSSDIIYIDPTSLVNEGDTHGYGHGTMPEIPSLPGVDISYPERFDYTSEYFFQNSVEDSSPWEAAVYPHGPAFLERSTQPLRTRKMFCWGRHAGGRNWLDHLSQPGQGDYVEIQAGLTPTQVHGADLPAHSECSFTQAFGSIGPGVPRDGSWEAACQAVRQMADLALPPETIAARQAQYRTMSDTPCGDILHRGHGWGALENLRRRQAGEAPTPPQLAFSPDGTPQEAPWLALLEARPMPSLAPTELPCSWMVDSAWRPLLEKAAAQTGKNLAPLVYLGVLEYENGREDLAIHLWEQANNIVPTVIAHRCLAVARDRQGETEEALSLMRQAFELEGESKSVAITQEYFAMLQAAGRYETLWNAYLSLPAEVAADERIIILTCPAALAMGQEAFLEQAYRHPFAVIREGENQMCEVWFRHQAMKAAAGQPGADLEILTQQMRQTRTPPRTIDYRLAQA